MFFAIHWHESALDLHVFPIPIPPPSCWLFTWLKRTRWLWDCCPQIVGTRDRPVAYLPKRLDSVAIGWPGYLRAVAAVASLVREATKLTLGQALIVKVPHEVNTLLRGDPTNGCQHPRLLSTRGCCVRTPMLLLSLVRPWIRPLSFLWEKVGPHMIVRKA